MLPRDVFRRGALPLDDTGLRPHRPTATDPSLAPAGRDASYALAPVSNLGVGAGADRTQAGPRPCGAVLGILDRTESPGVEGALATDFSVAPPRPRDEPLSGHGAGFPC